MFSTFPDEWPGAGLLLLRVAGGLGLITQGIIWFGDKHSRGPLTIALATLTAAVGFLVLIGCLTRLAAAVAAVVSVLLLFPSFPGPRVGLFETPVTATLAAVLAVALVCLGPGAFSLDARWFGQREVVIPKNPHRDEI
jgi:uncharacterized membrane protein YphA (DoxX/SURF4 family)